MTEIQLRSAVAHQKESGAEIPAILLETGLINEVDLARGLASFFKFPLVNLSRIRVTKQALKRATGDFCRRQQVLPFGLDPATGDLLVAVSDPAQVGAIDALRFRNGQTVKPYVAPSSQLREAIEFYYFGAGAGNSTSPPAAGAPNASVGADFSRQESKPSNGGLSGLGSGRPGGFASAPGTAPLSPDTGRRPHHRLGQLNSLSSAEPSGAIESLDAQVSRLKKTVRRLEHALRQEIHVSQALAELLVENGLVSVEQLKTRLKRD